MRTARRVMHLCYRRMRTSSFTMACRGLALCTAEGVKESSGCVDRGDLSLSCRAPEIDAMLVPYAGPQSCGSAACTPQETSSVPVDLWMCLFSLHFPHRSPRSRHALNGMAGAKVRGHAMKDSGKTGLREGGRGMFLLSRDGMASTYEWPCAACF